MGKLAEFCLLFCVLFFLSYSNLNDCAIRFSYYLHKSPKKELYVAEAWEFPGNQVYSTKRLNDTNNYTNYNNNYNNNYYNYSYKNKIFQVTFI